MFLSEPDITAPMTCPGRFIFYSADCVAMDDLIAFLTNS